MRAVVGWRNYLFKFIGVYKNPIQNVFFAFSCTCWEVGASSQNQPRFLSFNALNSSNRHNFNRPALGWKLLTREKRISPFTLNPAPALLWLMRINIGTQNSGHSSGIALRIATFEIINGIFIHT
ncbi:hypothetical protein ROLI_048300 (plasmid) [Roseobacter fucihabitans]|uniref:Uncharacterized protein n=1 Tax=Roseobacter fucihabitans TaxID=1537242 RepID=A0ABZ2C257_9RHOB|nr:hypothetical protein [Roseobacter litoralis]